MAREYIRITGLRELALAAAKLKEETKRKIAGDALVAGARIVRNAARVKTPVLKNPDPRRTAGTLQRSIVAVRTRKGDHPDEVVAIVGVRLPSKASIKKFKEQSGKSGASNPRDPYYWWFVEAGTRGHTHRDQSIAGVRMIKRGFEGNAQQAAEKIRAGASKAILKYGNSLAKGK